MGGVAVSPRQFAALYVGSRGIPPDQRTANVKRVCVEGTRGGRGVTRIFDVVVEAVGRSASSTVTGTFAAIAADHVAQGGPVGVHPPEGACDATAVVEDVRARGIAVAEHEVERPSSPGRGAD